MTKGTRAAIAAMVGAVGASVMLAIMINIGSRLQEMPFFLSAAAAGAAVAGATTAPLLGQRAKGGIAMAALGAVASTLLGATLAGAVVDIMSDRLGGVVGFAAVFVAGSIVSQPVVAAIWGLGFTATHVMSLRLRASVIPEATD